MVKREGLDRPVPVIELLERFLKPGDWQALRQRRLIREVWERVLPAALAEQTRLVDVRRKELWVEVSASPWVQEHRTTIGMPPPGFTEPPTEKEVRVLRALLRRFEGEVLEAIGDHAVDGAFVGVILLADVEWRPTMLEDNVLPQVFQAHPLKLVHDTSLERQVVGASEWVCVVDVRDVWQDLQAIAAGGATVGSVLDAATR